MADELYRNKIERMETIVAGDIYSGNIKPSGAFARMAELDLLTSSELDDLLHDLRLNEEHDDSN